MTSSRYPTQNDLRLAAHESVTEMSSNQNSLDARRDAIRQQMVELNRQRLLAQAKMNELRLQEQQFSHQVSLHFLHASVDI